MDVTENKLEALRIILKSPEKRYNARTLSQALGMSAMGALKMLRQLEQESVLKAEKIAHARFYRLNMKQVHTREYLKFALSSEAVRAPAHVRRWIRELQKIEHAELGVLFGSALEKKEPRDIDVLLVTDQKRFARLKGEVEKINALNVRQIHPLFQSHADLVKNIKERDAVILNAVKGIVVFGAEALLRVYDESCEE